MSDDHEELLSLEEVRRLLLTLFFNEHGVGDPARKELNEVQDRLTQDIDRLIQVALDKWRQAKNQIMGLDLADDLARAKSTTRPGQVPRIVRRGRIEEAQHQRSLRAEAIQRFEELSPQDDLRRIRKIDLTIEQWVKILEREQSARRSGHD